jgi:hypothetical protein
MSKEALDQCVVGQICHNIRCIPQQRQTELMQTVWMKIAVLKTADAVSMNKNS